MQWLLMRARTRGGYEVCTDCVDSSIRDSLSARISAHTRFGNVCLLFFLQCAWKYYLLRRILSIQSRDILYVWSVSCAPPENSFSAGFPRCTVPCASKFSWRKDEHYMYFSYFSCAFGLCKLGLPVPAAQRKLCWNLQETVREREEGNK